MLRALRLAIFKAASVSRLLSELLAETGAAAAPQRMRIANATHACHGRKA